VIVILAISIKEPWASLIVQGKKTLEVRSWATKIRGDILLCASASPPGPLAGKAFAVVEITDCRKGKKSDSKAACCQVGNEDWVWVLGNVRPLPQPFAVKGYAKFYQVEMP
jgi:predicted transcriptional regulator